MKILFLFSAHPNSDITGAGHYHRLLIAMLERHGIECVVNQKIDDFDAVIGGAFSLRQYNDPRPSFVIIHNERHEHMPLDRHGIIYVAEHIKARFNYKCRSSIVWHPMCRLKAVRSVQRKMRNTIGVVNINRDKGGYDVREVAAMMPGHTFKVLQSWGNQVAINIPNVGLLSYTNEMEAFYKAIDTLFCPSYSEGYNTTVLEAMSQGVAVVGRSIPGIMEVAGDAGRYAQSNLDFVRLLEATTADHKKAALARFFDVQQDESNFISYLSAWAKPT
jgi:hypothetical protein